MIRCVAALLVALLLPVQGFAAACAQICAATRNAQMHAVTAVDGGAAETGDEHCAGHGEPRSPHGEDDGSTLGAGKCCQAHVFAVDRPASAQTPESHSAVRNVFVARWSNFIPDEPSPPPIASFTNA